MEVSGVVARQVPCFFHRDSDAHPSSLSLSGVSISSVSRDRRLTGRRNPTASFTSRTQHGVMDPVFSDDGHMKYYVGPRCHRKSEKEKVKKKLKLLKGLSGDLFASSQMGFVLHPSDGLVDELQGKLISVQETRETLVRQLQQLKAEEKELKRKRKLEKAKLKASRMQTILDSSSSSSSSSESSENEGGDVIDMSYFRREALSHLSLDGWQTSTVPESTMAPASLQTQQHSLPEKNSNTQFDLQNRGTDSEISSTTAASGQRVEVCMGNKCRKAGAAMLLEEFERVLGVDGAVCGCKCMGKCRDGPNVRILNSLDRDKGTYPGSEVSATTPTDPLCIGVGLEDVGGIVVDFLGQKVSSLVPAT